jgi:uncharacterized protein YeaO (DUF488 family)
MIKVKRIYSQPDKNDGLRILVDRLCPRGMTKEKAKIDLRLKNIAPDAQLRKWFSHQPERWPEFKKRYFKELEGKNDLLSLVISKADKKDITLLYAAKNDKFNNASALKEFLEK